MPFALIAALSLAACGSDPAAGDVGADATADASPDVPLGDAGADVPLGDAGVDVPLGDVDSNDAAACPGSAGFECAQSCATDVSIPAVCEAGAWICPPDAPVNIEECGLICTGGPDTCCDSAGVPVAAQECIQGLWICDIGSTAQCTDQSAIGGRWRQVAWLPCPNDEVTDVPDVMIGELNFETTGFDLTWEINLFESYRDYWGSFTYDPASGMLELEITGGNNVPTRVDLVGTVNIIDGDLYLREHWFGTVDDDPSWAPPTLCGVQLTRW